MIVIAAAMIFLLQYYIVQRLQLVLGCGGFLIALIETDIQSKSRSVDVSIVGTFDMIGLPECGG